jgi:hypothetical protein
MNDEEKQSGTHRVAFDARSSTAASLSSGVYFYRLTARKFSDTKKMILLP